MTIPVPVDPFWNTKILTGLKTSCKLYYGTDSWGRKEWIGNLYPHGTREKEFLGYYVKHFNAIELNATHYENYPVDAIRKWRDKADGDFRFCPKVPQEISHKSNFANVVDVAEKLWAFLLNMSELGPHLGPVFLDVSETFTPKKRREFFNFLQELPKDKTFFIGLSNPEWFEESEFEPLLTFLAEQQLGFIIKDIPGSALRLNLTIPKCFIGYDVDGDPECTHVRQWFEKIQDWESRGLTEAYFFVRGTDKSNVLKALNIFKSLIH